MHGCPRCPRDKERCNAYCDNDIHADLVYGSPKVEGWSTQRLVQLVQTEHLQNDHCHVCQILTIRPLAEAPTRAQRYPYNAIGPPDATVPYLVRYTVTQEGATS